MPDQLGHRERMQRALWGALGFAFALALAHLGHGVGLILALGMPPLTGFAAQAFAMEFAMALGLGLALGWLYWLPRGEWLHPVAMAAATIAVERVVAVDPSKLAMWIAPSVVALGMFAAGRWVAARRPRVVVALCAALPVGLLALPVVADALRGDDERAVNPVDPPAGAPDVLMIVMDTVRAQSCSVNGYGRDTTPNLERLAAEGAVFLDAYAPATWSLPAHAALFTGTFPSHNAAHGETRHLGPELPTLAETLVAAGWQSYAFSANPHISPSFGLTRGFQHTDKAWAAGTSARNFSFIYRVVDAAGLGRVEDKGGRTVVGNIARWMASRPADDRPAFVFVNFLEAHFPREYREAYQHADMNTLREIDQIAFGVQFGRQLTPEEMDFVRQPLVDLYDGGVKYTDHLVGEVVDIWRRAGRLDNTVVVVLADHGEVVGEHGAFGHVTPVLEQDLRVPLVIRYPKRIGAGTRVETPVSTVGTFATILDLAGGPPAPGLQVPSLVRVIDGDARAGEPILAERFEEEMLAARFPPGAKNGEGEQVDPRGRYRVFRSGQWKLVQHWRDGQTRSFLFDLVADPGEDRDVAGEQPAVLARVSQELRDELDRLGLPPIDAEVTAPSLDVAGLAEDEKASLCALGYLEGPDCE